MNSRLRNGSVGRRLLWVAVGLAIIVGLSILAYPHIKRHSEALRIAEGTTIDGFSRTAVSAVTGGDDDPYSGAVAYFVGPAPRPDVISVTKVPTIELRPETRDTGPSGDKIDTLVAHGERADGCAAWVRFISLSRKDSPQPEWNLTGADLSGIKSGSRVLIYLDVTRCGWYRN